MDWRQSRRSSQSSSKKIGRIPPSEEILEKSKNTKSRQKKFSKQILELQERLHKGRELQSSTGAPGDVAFETTARN
ncbi:MAG: hypothetical protein ABEJ72_00905 [Candidatus Aenigmatarchaeota archaeon]